MQPTKKPTRSVRATAIGVTGLMLAGVGAAAILMADRPSSPEATIVALDAAPLSPTLEPPAAEPPPAPKPVAPTPPAPKAARPKAETRTASRTPASVSKPAQRTPARAAVTEPVAAAPIAAVPASAPAEDAPARSASAVEPVARPVEQEPEPVTITGCLERRDDTFRLKNTSGADAPKSRSWKSGFLRRSAATIEIVAAPRGVNLDDHVGQRISVSGTLFDREMQVLSMQPLAPSCG
jgi:hypothetical protein